MLGDADLSGMTGIDPADPIASRKARIAAYLRMIADLDANGQHLSEQISEIDLTDPEDARVLMPEQGEDILAHFGEDKFVDRFGRYKEHIGEWRKQYPHLASVDLRYDRQVVLQMKNASTVDAGSSDKAADTDKPRTAQEATAAQATSSTAKAATTKTTAAAAKADDKAKPVATSAAKPKKLASKDNAARQKASKQETAREKALELKAAQMRAARAKAAAKQHRKPVAQTEAAEQDKKPVTVQAAANVNGQKTAKPHPGQPAGEGQ